MTNAYVSLDTLKSSSVLNVTGAADDSRLRALAENASRIVDRYCNRHLYVVAATRRFDGLGTPSLLVPDLVSVDGGGLKTDDDKDRVFETTWAGSDTCCCHPTPIRPRAATLSRVPTWR